MSYLKKVLCEVLIWIDFIGSCLPGRIGRVLRRLLIRSRVGSVGKAADIGVGVEILGASNISMGDSVSIMKFSSLYAQDRATLEIGSNVSMNSNVSISANQGKISIGDFVLIGQNVVIRASNHNFNDVSLPIMDQGHSEGGVVIIENDCWIGANAVIVGGVRIGRGSVVGAGSVVTKDVKPFSVVGGVPAKLLRSRLERS